MWVMSMQCHVAYRSRECCDKDFDELEDGNSQPKKERKESLNVACDVNIIQYIVSLFYLVTLQ